MKKIINFIFAISLVAGLFLGCNNSVTLSEETLDISGSRAVVRDAKRTSTIRTWLSTCKLNHKILIKRSKK